MSKKVLFLDTTIQIKRQVYDPQVQEEIEDKIKEFDLPISSKYVKMEFTRAFIDKGLIFLYNLARRLGDFALIFTQLSKLPPIQRRRINQALISLGKFFSEKELPSAKALEKLLIYLPQAINEAWERFDESVDECLVDETGCSKANEKPVMVGNTYEPFRHCKQADKRCKIDEFFNKNKPQFELILKELSKMPNKDPELLKLEDVLKKALKYPGYMLESKNCWSCGDAIIAVECPKEALLFTTNLKHYQPLLAAISKKCIGINEEIEKLEEPEKVSKPVNGQAII